MFFYSFEPNEVISARKLENFLISRLSVRVGRDNHETSAREIYYVAACLDLSGTKKLECLGAFKSKLK